MKTPELLCPVGGMDTLSAALLSGADAVYLGAKDFNARMNAKNFDRPALSEAIARCHEKGVRLYVTLNTLLTDRNLPEALDLVSFLYGVGCDALILADVGFASLCHRFFPDFELHASTQMSGHNASFARVMQKSGFSRMVCAREMDRENLRLLCQASPLEIELFVHGAICASASGQCLMSSMIGNRSGNRGACAQPCRLPYNGSYPLSFKDLSLASHMKEILSLGVSSLKIEGRMKSPEYVYSTARLFRTLLDEKRNATPKEMASLAAVFSRSGFTDGYFTRNLSAGMLGIRTQEDKKKSAKSAVLFRDAGRVLPAITVKREEKVWEMPPLGEKIASLPHRSARFFDARTIPKTDFFDEIYLPLDRFDPAVANGVVMPPVIFPSEEKKVREMLERACGMGARHVLVGNAGHFSLTEGLDLTLHGDFRLNLTNSFSLGAYPALSDAIVSPELNLAQLRDLRGRKSVIVYGRLPLMLLEKRVGANTLRDRRGAIFPILREAGRDLVVNSVPFFMADRQKQMKEYGLVSEHFIFTVETRSQVEEVIRSWRLSREPKGNVKRIK